MPQDTAQGVLVDISDLNISEMTAPVTDRRNLANIIPRAEGRVSLETLRANAVFAESLGFKSAAELQGKYAGQKIILCGGGPSIVDTLRDIRKATRVTNRVKVAALNKTHDWMIARGVVPDFGVMADPSPWLIDYMTPRTGVKYLLGSSLHQDVIKRFKGHPHTYLWHPEEKNTEWLKTKFSDRRLLIVNGKSTIGLRILSTLVYMGFSHIELHGFDSAYVGNSLHPYNKPDACKAYYDEFEMAITAPDGDEMIVRTSAMMARQVMEFQETMNEFRARYKGKVPFTVTVAGDGAIPWLAWKSKMHATPDRMAAKYGGKKLVRYSPIPQAEAA